MHSRIRQLNGAVSKREIRFNSTELEERARPK